MGSRALKVTADGAGLVGHAGAILLRKAADQAGLTGQLGTALRKAGGSPVFDRGVVLVSLAAAIALGATSVIAANIAADLAAWTHLLGLHDDADLREANPGMLRYRIWPIPARLARHARQRTFKISPD